MAKGTKVQKPKRRPVRAARSGKARARAVTKRKAAKASGTRDVFKRRATTYDLTLEEREELATVAAEMGRSTSEVLALGVRAFLWGVRAAKGLGNSLALAKASDETLGALVRRIAQVVEQAALSPMTPVTPEVLREIEKATSAASTTPSAEAAPSAEPADAPPETTAGTMAGTSPAL